MCPGLLAAIWKTAPSILSPEPLLLLLLSAGDISTFTWGPARTSDTSWLGLTSNLTSQIYAADFHSCSSHSGSPRITGLTHSNPHPSHTTCPSQRSPNELQNSRKCSWIRPPSHPHCSDCGPCQSLLTWPTQCLNFILSPTSSHPRPPAPAHH